METHYTFYSLNAKYTNNYINYYLHLIIFLKQLSTPEDLLQRYFNKWNK